MKALRDFYLFFAIKYFLVNPTNFVSTSSHVEGRLKRIIDSDSNNGNIQNNLEITSSISNLKYVGCFDVWKIQNPDHRLSILQNGNSDLTICEKYCLGPPLADDNDGPPPLPLFTLRGLLCGCLYWENNGLTRLSESSCNIICTHTEDIHRSCGGNDAISVYCNLTGPDQNNCRNSSELLPDIIEDPYENENENNPILHKGNLPILPCFNCTHHLNCWTRFFKVNLTYMPANTPYHCIRFCSRRLVYFNPITKKNETREPAKYANVGWAWANLQISVATCGCFNEFPVHANVTSDFCNKPCPENPDQMCGGDPPYIFSMYETEVNDEPGLPSISTTEETTISSNTGETTSLATITSTDMETSILTTTHFDASTAVTTTEITNSPPTTMSPEKIETPKPAYCTLKCQKTDRHRQNWTACAGEIKKRTCPNNASGYAIWNCSTTGKFVGESPDFSNCTTLWIGEIETELGDDKIIPDKASEILHNLYHHLLESKYPSIPETNFFGHEINRILKLVSKVFSQLETNVSVIAFDNLTEAAIRIIEFLLIYPDPWQDLSVLNRSSTGTNLIKLIEVRVFELTKRAAIVPTETERPGEYRKIFQTHPDVVISSGGQPKSLIGCIKFPFDKELEDGSYIILPDSWADHVPGSGYINFVGMAFATNLIKPIFPETAVGYSRHSLRPPVLNTCLSPNDPRPDKTKFMNGKLMAFSVSLTHNSKENHINFLGEGVKIRFRHLVNTSKSEVKDLPRKLHSGETPKAVLGSEKCVYWDTAKLEWSSKGCKLSKSERVATLCECSHLTSFAVLMDMHNYMGKESGLEIMTLVLCPLSVICLFTTIIIFTMIRSTHGTRTTITKNLCISLLVGNGLVLIIVDRHYFKMSDGICMACGIFVHYVFLTAFMWMGIQGYHLYKQIVHVFESGTSHMTIYRVIAFGVPILIVGATCVIGFLKEDFVYGGQMFCWLKEKYIWAFMGPVAFICLGNTIVLIITLRAAHQVRSPNNIPDENMRIQCSKVWIKGGLSITVLLGLTWISGYFMMTDSISSAITAYIFTALNASQGIFLFLFHCILNENVRTALVRKNILPNWLTRTSIAVVEPRILTIQTKTKKTLKSQFQYLIQRKGGQKQNNCGKDNTDDGHGQHKVKVRFGLSLGLGFNGECGIGNSSHINQNQGLYFGSMSNLNDSNSSLKSNSSSSAESTRNNFNLMESKFIRKTKNDN